MAAAEYYNTSVDVTAPSYTPHQQSPYHQSPYQQSPNHRPQELHGSPVPQFALHPSQQRPQPTPPPPYSSPRPENKPAVHFASSPSPAQQRPSVSSSGRPSFSNQSPPRHGQYLQPPPPHGLRPQNGAYNGPPHMRPYMNGNHSEAALGGYTSDPEEKRRRRHRRRNSKDDESSSRDMRSSRDRSRSTNTDGFLGAAGGGLIGDLIFPGLGTVGGAVAGWIGGKNYGRHREGKEEKLQREQKDWEHKFRDRSHSRDRRRDHDQHHHGHRRSSPRHRDEHY